MLGLAIGSLLSAASSLTPSAASAFDRAATAAVIAAPAIPRPHYLQPVRDPVFGTQFTRVTDPGRLLAPGASCRQTFCRHHYSSSQAWNADQSLLLISRGATASVSWTGRLMSRSSIDP
jgi:hypothetical protein